MERRWYGREAAEGRVHIFDDKGARDAWLLAATGREAVSQTEGSAWERQGRPCAMHTLDAPLVQGAKGGA